MSAQVIRQNLDRLRNEDRHGRFDMTGNRDDSLSNKKIAWMNNQHILKVGLVGLEWEGRLEAQVEFWKGDCTISIFGGGLIVEEMQPGGGMTTSMIIRVVYERLQFLSKSYIKR